MNMEQRDIDQLVEILVNKAVTATLGLGVQGYYKGLVLGADLPSAFKQQKASFTGDPHFDAVDLINWALAKGTNPRTYASTLGALLITQFAGSGLEEASTLASIILKYKLCKDEQIDGIATRYQIPQLAADARDFGPDIDWRGPEVQLQSWFADAPNLLDVGFLKQAIERATGVCRIEVGLTKERGTGVLIDQDLMLTNYHVFGKTPEEITAALPTTKVRFGVFTRKDGKEETGQQLSLNAASLLDQSPIKELDFVLLSVPAVREFTDVKPPPFSILNPTNKSAVHILQHPEGGSMKLAISANGVTGAYPDSGYLQYVSRTSPGSSGGPCFDDDWNVVAIHHAVRSKAFGVVGEGILLSRIHQQIKPHLKAQPA